jgi:hypothetical protein
MMTQEEEFLKLIKLFSDNDCLKDLVLIGSWAEYVYQHTGMLPPHTTALFTLDVDFLIRNLHRPQPPISIASLAKEAGYVIDVDRLSNTTKIRTSSRLEVEFLIHKRGSGLESVYDTNLGVTAQGLRNLDLLYKHAIVQEYLGFHIQIPVPEAYVIHKMIINNERREDKKVKDQQKIESILPYLDNKKCQEILSALTKKEMTRVRSFVAEHKAIFSVANYIVDY